MRLTCEQGRCAPRNSVAQNKKSKKMTTLVMMYDGYWIVVLFGGSTSRTRFDLWSLVFQQYFITLNRCKVMTIVINKFEVWSYSLRSEFKQCCTSTSCESWPRTPPHEEPFLFQSLVALILKRRSGNTHFAAWRSFERRDRTEKDWYMKLVSNEKNRDGAALVYALEKPAVNRWPNAGVVLQREHFTFINC